jgi:hypothetical protein
MKQTKEEEKMQTPQTEVAQTPVEEIQTPTEVLHTPVEEPQEETTTPEPTTWSGALQQGYNGLTSEYESMLQSRGDMYAQKVAERKAYQQKLDDAQQRYMDALNNKQSVMGALLQKQKPVYDADKEKRLRNNAIIQSFGDLLTEATKGAFAFNKKSGAGVYIPRDKDYALNDINEINRMREEYLKRNEAWKALGNQMEAENAASQVAAADALRTKAEGELKEASKEEQTAKDDYIKGAEAYLKEKREMIKNLIDTGQKEEAAEELRNYRGAQLELGLYRAQADADNSNSKGNRSGNGKRTAEEIKLDKYLVANIAYSLGLVTDDDLTSDGGKDANGRTVTKQHSIYDVPDSFLDNIYANYINDPRVRLGIYLSDEEYSLQDVNEMLTKVKNNPKAAQEIIDEMHRANLKASAVWSVYW